MTAMYDTVKQFNRILYWDDDNRLTKTVDTTNGSSIATSYAYDTKGMRISKDGPYGKTIYIDTGYVESGATQTAITSNHIFVGNTRVASVVKHTEEKQPATYFYASDHLGSSSVLTTQTGSYHERIEYLPYGEVWVEDAAINSNYSTPYKFTGKELDKETGLYYFGARYYDARVSRWISADPALALYLSGKPNGGIYNPINIDVYRYAQNRPILFIDPNGMWEDKSITVAYENKGVNKKADINMGTVTEGDTLVKLAEMQLKNETGSNKFNGKDVENKVQQIKQINSIKGDTIKTGQNLVLGVSNDKIIGEHGIKTSDIDLLIAGGVGYGLTKAGIAGAGMLAEAALSTEVGTKAVLYGGSLLCAAQSGLRSGQLQLNAIQAIPGVGNAMLMYGPEMNQYGGAFINGFMPSGPLAFFNFKETLYYGSGYFIEKLLDK